MDVVIVIVVVALMMIGFFGWYHLLSGRSGERYLRQRAQGPFVPLESRPEDDRADRTGQRL